MKMREHIKRHKFEALPIIFIASFACTGIFYEHYSCAFSVIWVVFLLWKMQERKQLVFVKNSVSLSIVILILLYGVSTLWAVDSGMSWFGTLKFLPVLLFLIALMQEKDCAEKILKILPYVAAVFSVVSIIGMQVPALESYFSVAGRVAGFFQYPNTFALFLLVNELLLVGRKKNKILDYIAIVVLVIGLLLTGSRTVFILAILANGIFVFFNKNKKIRMLGLVGIVFAVAGVMIYAFLFDGADAIVRLFRISFTESTFVGRILYFVDALPVIMKSPFGLGYMGYYYIQQSIQTGLYSVRYIHNDFLQILLDVGWIPCVLLFIAIIKSLFNKKMTFVKKLILVVICLHSCFDFNLQFVSMFWLLLLFMDYETGEEVVIKKQLKGIKCGLVVTACICIYCGISLTLFELEKYELSLKLYPWNTQAASMYLTEIEDVDDAGEVADSILERNEYVTIAQSAKARQAYSKGDFGSLITYKNELLDKAPFQYEEYEDYCYMLINGISLYTKAGDTQSANICKQELLAIPDKLQQAEDKISKLGKMIKDQPTTELPEDISAYISGLEETH